MAPKPAPKLTRKQLEELRKQEARKKEQEQKQRRQAEEIRLAEQRKLQQIENAKRAQEERLRIIEEKQQYDEQIKKRKKQQEKAYSELKAQIEWENSITPYYQSYEIQGANLSTFMRVFREYRSNSPGDLLKQCQRAQNYIKKIYQTKLSVRVQGLNQLEHQLQEKIHQIRNTTITKIQEIMVEMANGAQQMDERNIEFLKTKNDSKSKSQMKKLQEYEHYMSSNFKIGMYLNSTTMRNQNPNKWKPIEIKEFGLNTEVPSKWFNTNAIVKFQWTNFNPYSPNFYDDFLIIGGVYNIQFYDLPAGSKRRNNIIVKKSYKGKQVLQKCKLSTALIKEPFQLMYEIPRYAFLASFQQSTLQVAQYDFFTLKWSVLPNDSIVDYLPDEKRIVCRVSRPQPLAYVMNRYTDFPYISWEMRTVEPGKVLLDIELKRFMPQREEEQAAQHLIVQFQIYANAVKLNMDTNYSQFQDLHNKEHTPQQILHQMSQRGIHLLPQERDYQRLQLTPKNKESQRNAIKDIAYAVESFFIRSDPQEGQNVGVKIRENSDYEFIFLQDQEKDWKRIKWGDGDRCWVQSKHRYERHLNLEVLLDNHPISEEECVQRMKFNKQYLLRHTLIRMMTLTGLLSFTTTKAQESHLRDILKAKLIVQ